MPAIGVCFSSTYQDLNNCIVLNSVSPSWYLPAGISCQASLISSINPDVNLLFYPSHVAELLIDLVVKSSRQARARGSGPIHVGGAAERTNDYQCNPCPCTSAQGRMPLAA